MCHLSCETVQTSVVSLLIFFFFHNSDHKRALNIFGLSLNTVFKDPNSLGGCTLRCF